MELIVTIQAVWLVGATLCVALPPDKQKVQDNFKRRLELIQRTIRPDLILVEDGRGKQSSGLNALPLPNCSELARLSSSSDSCPPADPDDLAILQLTSGTTGTPKAVRVPYGCLVENIQAMAQGLQATPEDSFLSWLPLSHDMGLIGTLGISMMLGASLVVMDPMTFASDPKIWMQSCSDYQASIICAPNSIYGLAARFLQRQSNLDLTGVRVAVDGSEPIDVGRTLEFLAAGKRFGLKDEVAFPVYGLAEATLGVTFSKVGMGMEYEQIDPDELDLGRATPTGQSNGRCLAFVGEPLRRVGLSIRRDGESVGDRTLGEICLTGPSITPGYFNEPDRPSDELLKTGDLGYLVGTKLVVCGRTSDLIIVGGRNILPEGIEEVVRLVPGVWRNNSVAFGIVDEHERERVVVMAESEAPSTGPIASTIRRSVMEQLGIVISEVQIVAPRSLPKTTSGKISRSMCRTVYLGS